MNEADTLAFAGESGKWHPIKKLGRTVPFGYKENPDNPKELLPVELELEALEKAREYVKRYSLRDVADWLSQATGRRISHVGLKKRLDDERKRKTRLRTIKGWATRYRKVLQEAEKLQKDYPGSQDREDGKVGEGDGQ